MYWQKTPKEDEWSLVFMKEIKSPWDSLHRCLRHWMPSPRWCCLHRIKWCGLVGGSMPVEADSESLKSHAILSLLSMLPICSSRCKLSACCSCWRASALPLWTHPSGTTSPQNSFFYKLSWLRWILTEKPLLSTNFLFPITPTCCPKIYVFSFTAAEIMTFIIVFKNRIISYY